MNAKLAYDITRLYKKANGRKANLDGALQQIKIAGIEENKAVRYAVFCAMNGWDFQEDYK